VKLKEQTADFSYKKIPTLNMQEVTGNKNEHQVLMFYVGFESPQCKVGTNLYF
jgi:hypothetical protein